MSENARLLQRIYRHVRSIQKSGMSCLLAFDLDATLFDVSHRHQKVIQDFTSLPQTHAQFSHHLEKLKEVRFSKTDWAIDGPLERVGLLGQEDSAELYDLLHDFWYEKYFSNEYLEYDRPYDGAVEFVQKIWQAGADVVYLTGRDIPRMGEGSLKTLKRWNFPVAQERAQLLLKKEKGLNDARFKADWFLHAKQKDYSHAYFFENEPVNLQVMATDCPHVELIFFDSSHSGKALPPQHAARFDSYLVSLEETF